MSQLKWYLKQLFPFTYVSNYGTQDGQYVCVWKMWMGRSYNIREWKVEQQVYPAIT